jgi:hypothetical protein
MDRSGTEGTGPAAHGSQPGPAGTGGMPPSGTGTIPPPAPGPAQPGGPGEGGRRRYRYRSLFWPIVLIGAGVIWLLYSLDAISSSDIEALSLVWPVFVIGIGADLLVGHRSPAAGAIVGVVTVGVVIVLMLVGTGAGWVGTGAGLKTETFSTPVGGATQAQIEIGLSGYDSSIHALPQASGAERPLLYATVTHRGTIDFSVNGSTEKTVTLKPGSGWLPWQGPDAGAEPWDIGLDPGLPLAVTVNASSGSSRLDLTGLRLSGLVVQASSGDSQIALPATDSLSSGRPEIRLQSSSGRMDVQAPDRAFFAMSVGMSSGDTRVTLGRDSSVDLSFRGSSGQFVLTVGPGQALRVEVKSISSGDVSLPDGLARVSGDGKKGVWQTAGYDSASDRVDLVVESMSSGSVKVQVEG